MLIKIWGHRNHHLEKTSPINQGKYLLHANIFCMIKTVNNIYNPIDNFIFKLAQLQL